MVSWWLNHWRPCRPKSAVQDYTALKYCNFLNHLKMAWTVSSEHWVECTSSWDIQYMQKSQRLLQNITFWIWKRTKMIVFKVTEERQKSRLLPSGFWQKSSLQNQKSTLNEFEGNHNQGRGGGEETRCGTKKRCFHNLQSGHPAWWSADNCSIFPTVNIFRLFRSKKRTGRGNQKCLKNWKK